MYVRKEAVLSSQIEGTQASLIDVLEFEVQALEPGKPQDVSEVVNYLDAMNYGLARLRELPVSLRLIREIHQRLMSGVRGHERLPGEFRNSQNWIGAQGCGLKDALFIPPPPAEMKTALHDLEKFLHDPTPIPFLIKAGLVHAQFETIHPFLDGNGRVGRLLITFLMCEQRVLQRPLLYLSYFFKRNRTEYYDRLQAVRDLGAWEPWLKFFLRGVYEVSHEATDTARKIVNLREEHRELVRANVCRGTAKALHLLENLYERPVLNVKSASEIVGLSFANANNLIETFENLGLLTEMTGNLRNRLFSYNPYLQLFEGD